MTTSTVTGRPAYSEHSISPLAFWAATAEERETTFARLRAEAPLSFHPPIEGALMMPENDGVWAVASHALIAEVSKAPDVFCSGRGFQMEEVPDDFLEAAGSFLGMDAPEHPVMRRRISAAFTSKQVRRIEDQIRAQAAAIVDGVLERGEGDFVHEVSKRLPMWTVYEMLGLDDHDTRDRAAGFADDMVSWADPEVAAGREPLEMLNEALVGLLMIGMELAEQRRSDPRDDLMSSLVAAEVDGRQLTDEEIGSFFVLLSVAGNDTTRNTVSITAHALQEHPDQRAFLLDDFAGRIPLAMEEFVRWATPVMTFRRTATRDVELGGQQVRAGDWLALLYSSGNRDEAVFDRPLAFDLSRSPNPHLGFGGGGPHYCMGRFVAKMQLRELFDQLLHRVPTLELGAPSYLAGNFVRSVKSLPYAVR